MAPKSLQNPEIERLIRLGAQSRAQLTLASLRLRETLDIPTRLRGSLKRHPSSWLFGSLASGLAISLLLGGKRSQRGTPDVTPQKKRHRSLPVAAAGLVLTAARPIAKHWFSKQAEKWLANVMIQSQRQP